MLLKKKKHSYDSVDMCMNKAIIKKVCVSSQRS